VNPDIADVSVIQGYDAVPTGNWIMTLQGNTYPEKI
jgi:hypothetical protein